MTSFRASGTTSPVRCGVYGNDVAASSSGKVPVPAWSAGSKALPAASR
ncbi:hypothetical protein [Georgenia sp. SUBG003]